MTHASRRDPLRVRPDAHCGEYVALVAHGATRAFLYLFDENGIEHSLSHFSPRTKFSSNERVR